MLVLLAPCLRGLACPNGYSVLYAGSPDMPGSTQSLQSYSQRKDDEPKGLEAPVQLLHIIVQFLESGNIFTQTAMCKMTMLVGFLLCIQREHA